MYRLWCHEILILETHSIYFNGILFLQQEPAPSYILLHLLGGTGTVRSTTVTITAIRLKRSSASRSVNLQTKRTKTRQFKFTRNQGFTQAPRGNEAAVESSGQCADNEANSQATARSPPNTRQTVKESHLAGHNTNTCFPETRSSWLYTNSAFNSLTNDKEERFQRNHSYIHRK